MDDPAPRVVLHRKLLIALAALAMALLVALALAGLFLLFRARFGTVAAALVGSVVVVGGVVLFRPAWLSMRRWASAPWLETGRRELIRALDALPATAGRTALAERVLELCERLLPGRAWALLLAEPGSERLVTAAVAGSGEFTKKGPELPLGSDLARALEREGRSLVVTGWPERVDGREACPEGVTAVPLAVVGELKGVLVISRTANGRGLSREQLGMVEHICALVAGAFVRTDFRASLSSARTEVEVTRRELVALQRVAVAAQGALDEQEVLRAACDGVVEGLEYEEAIAFLIDAVARTVTPVAAAGRAVMPKLRARATTRDGRPFRLNLEETATRRLVPDAIRVGDDPMESILPYLVENDGGRWRDVVEKRTIVTVPLPAGGETVGGMVLVTRRRSIGEGEQASLRGFAAQAAAAIVNARLYSDLREAYDDLRVAQDELIRTERMRTVGEVAGGVAHDFNNILLAVLTHAQLAGRHARELPVRQALTVIEQAALDGAEVVKRIQNLTRAVAPASREPVDLNTIVRQSLEIAEPIWQAAAAGATITTRTELGPSGRMQGAPSELREVFVNLLLNAAQAMPEGGTLWLRTYLQDGHCWGEVGDTGAGMSAEVKRRAFEPFFTTKGTEGGGLGLSVVASIVRRHGGLIEVASEPGRGTTVAVGFPVAIAAPRPLRAVPHLAQVGQEGLEILVIEADARVREAVQMMLEQLGHRVRATGDARDALSRFLDGDYALVLTDLNLESYSGLDVARAVKRMSAGTEVVLVTGIAADVADPAAHGVDRVLAKPFTVEQVEAVIDGVRAKRAAGSRPAVS